MTPNEENIHTSLSEHSDALDPIRLGKLAELKELGRDPFAFEKFDVSHRSEQIIAGFDVMENVTVSVAGRVTNSRLMGKAAFIDVTDSAGRIQVYIRKDEVGEEKFDDVRHRLDLGDIVGVTGYVFKTKTGEISVHASQFDILSKALRNLPIGKEYETEAGEERHTGALKDPELRFRQRYVDLIVNKSAKQVLLDRVKVVRAMRDFLDNQQFLEVETPVLQTIAGGAAARPFLTHHNTLNMELHLRISLELYLKRLIVGGLDRVYEIGRVFRNEGVSTRHNPEFTLMELYAAYANLEDMMVLVEGMYRHISRAIHGKEQFEFGDHTIDVSQSFKRLPILQGIQENAGVDAAELGTLSDAHAVLKRLGMSSENEPTVGGIIEKLHEKFTQPTLIQPTFITEFPLETSPLAKKVPGNPLLTRRFEVYVAGSETGNAFSEINDPIDQRDRFVHQGTLREGGDVEAHPMDEDFLRALEYGMPPTGGFGAGVDRMAIIFTGAASIRDVIFFPLLRPHGHE